MFSRETALIVICVVSMCATDCPNSCSCSQSSVVCTSGLPSWLPKGTIRVTLNNIGVRNLSQWIFQHKSWADVEELTVQENSSAIEPHVQHVGPRAFSALRKLSTLKLHCHFLSGIDVYCFGDLNELRILDLSNSAAEDSDIWKYIIASLSQDSTLNKLQVLNLADVSPKYGALSLKSELLQAFKNRSMKELNLSKAPIAYINISSFKENLSKLEVLNLSRTLLTYLDENYYKLFTNLKIIDMRECRLYLPSFSFTGGNVYLPGFDLFKTVTEFYIGGIGSSLNFRLQNTTLELRPHNVSLTLEKLDMSNWGFHLLNITSVYGTDYCVSLVYFNMSCNNMEYVNPAVFKRCLLLRVLDLSKNQLHVMSKYHEFSLLFADTSSLEEVSLSYNKLSNIPAIMFTQNSKLRVLDLSNNRLEHVHFKISHLLELSSLDLRFNAITYLDSSSRNNLNSLYHTKLQKSKTEYEIKMAENPFVCTCAREKSVTFLVRTSLVIVDKTDMRCKLEGQFLLLNDKAITNTLYLCKRTTIIVASVTSSCIFAICLIVSLTLFVRWRRRRSEANRMRRLIQRFQEDRPDYPFRTENFLVFLCYCSQDEDFVEKNVRNQLSQTLQEMLRTQRELVSDGDTHFEAGRLIIDNIAKHIATSKVIVCVVSEAFCQSEWCTYEAKMSLFSDKPTILMFKETVPKKLMSKELRCLYQKYARAFWKEEEPGKFVLKPNWNRICKVICEFADYPDVQPAATEDMTTEERDGGSVHDDDEELLLA